MTAPDPVAFTVFGLDVRWYGILIVAGIIIATLIFSRRAPAHGFTDERALDFVLICVPIGIVGARLYYVLFNREIYDGIADIINLRNGGLAIHGGLIFGLGMAAILCVLWKIHPFDVLDCALPTVALAQAIGRWGNFFNSEAHGGPTDLPWGIMVDGVRVHPTFLYESIWCVLLFIFLSWIDSGREFRGQVALLYAILYSFERFFVEALRTDSLMIGDFKQAQVFSAAVFAVCLVWYIVLWRRAKKRRGKYYGI